MAERAVVSLFIVAPAPLKLEYARRHFLRTGHNGYRTNMYTDDYSTEFTACEICGVHVDGNAFYDGSTSVA